VHRALSFPYPPALRERLFTARSKPAACGLDELGYLDVAVGECFRDAALALLDAAGRKASNVTAVGSHGQTLRHRPDADKAFTLQIGDPSIIAAGTGIDTVADFRRLDMALGGQAAPLLPPFHDWLFRDDAADRVVVNIGGIANVTVLPSGGEPVTGFDTGPGNTLLDAWMRWHNDSAYDDRGAWAASGEVDTALLDKMCSDPWFAAAPPKSTGFERFNLDWLAAFEPGDASPADVQATLSELTAKTIADAILRVAPSTREVFVCGGGASNPDLMSRLAARLRGISVASTSAAGVDPDWIEATAFAWLAMRRLAGLPGNLPSVTGARCEAVLGAVYSAPESA
ncbi:MAG: anhydro-N-acetylmuramic acid kinase, partial [Woeseiaceae bacterium]|nr:anhydro-N-acetylmuramic acid kinase [Woeseiaceae bacterium]